MHNPYAGEAKKRWGDTEAYRQSQGRVKKMTKEDFALIQKKEDALMAEIAAHRDEGAASPKIQELIEAHHNNFRHFYEPNLKLYRGLAGLYIEDPRFSAYFEKYAPGLAQFMHDAMIAYCDAEQSRDTNP
ncbi:TipAS antibiotic-recognition domain-containing protein [Candidatus Peregrinibacteria bacterium]|nr:TipAS antibiotic-recognition domain-containing protein [Candidatus Peregrinibacteria bacterium]